MKNTRVFSTLLFSIVCLLFIFSASFAQQTAGQLFEKALYIEEARGELQQAIDLYQQILKQYPENRPVAAKALLHIGLCNEKLGRQEAQKAYQRLIEEYPGQKQEVAIAKERLAVLSKELEKVSHKPTFRNIRIPTRPGNGALSSDGKKLAFASKGSIWVVPVHGKVSPDIAGEPVRLTESMGAWNMGSTLSWSADCKWIAFNAKDKKKDAIYVIPSSGGKPKKIPVNLDRGGHPYNYRLSLSPDGKIVAFASEEKEKIQLFTVYVEVGEVNQLTEDGGTQPAFSPDGKKITYVKEKPQKTEIRKSDVWVIPAAGGTPVQVSDLPGRATGPIWSPDGKMIAFTRRAGGDDMSKEICIVPVSETGKTEESPKQIELPLVTLNFLAGWTPDNNIGVLLINPEHLAIYTVPASGGNATQVTPQGYTFHPRWSPDGERIYFRGYFRGNSSIVSVPSEGGEIFIGPLDEDSNVDVVLPGGGNAVSPNGGKIVFSGAKSVFRDNKKVYEVDIYTISIEGGEPKRLTISPGQDRFPCWSPDGKSIAFVRYPEPTKEKKNYIMNICIVRPEGGEVRQLTSESDKVAYSNIAWSPDGKSIAYFSSEDKAIRVIPVQGGESREVVKVEDVSSHSELDWLRDGKKLAYSSKGSIRVVSLDGGEPEEIKTGLDAKVAHISLSPDGEKIAFTAFKGGDTELCLMENFLPEEKEDKEFNIRQVWTDANIGVSMTGALGAISPDGRYISYFDWATGDVAIREIETGKKRHITNEGSLYDALASHSKWSPDSKQVVYIWSKDSNDIRIVGIDGGKPRILYREDEDERIRTYDWSPDGRHILALFTKKKDETNQIVSVSVADGSMRVLKTLGQQREGNWPTKICYSPDGRYIVYDYPSKKYSQNRDIFVLSADGSREIPLIEHPADDFLFGWAPDGEHILFASNRTGTLSFWLIQVSEGKPQGTPELVKSDMGPISPLGLSQKGSFYYLVSWNKRNIYVVEIDPGTGKILTQPKIAIKLFEGSNRAPEYSPDGKSLAYISVRSPFSLFRAGMIPGRGVLCIRSLETGEEREILTKLDINGPPKWSPDGNSILVPGSYNDTSRGLYKIDVQTGDVTPVVVRETIHISCEWSRDGKAVFFVSEQRKDNLCQIMVRDLESGEEKELYRENFPERFSISLSPDGQWLAFLNNRSTKRILRVIPAAGGEPRELYTWESDGQYIWHTWTADGRYILVPILSPKWALWRIPVEDGEPQKLVLVIHDIHFSVHPDGRHIAFSRRVSTDKSRGVWVMENFLPE